MYKVDLTRKDSNIYMIDGEDIIIHTRYCYVYAYSEEAIFDMATYGGELVFLESKDKCVVEAVFGRSEQISGRYAVRVSRDNNNWYEIFGSNSYIRTSNCIYLALGKEAYLTISSPGFGRLQFIDGNDCRVEGVYTKLQ